MNIFADNVDAYIHQMLRDRQEALTQLRQVIRDKLPEGMGWRWAWIVVVLLGHPTAGQSQMQWWPTEVWGSAGVWIAEGPTRDLVEGPGFGVHAAWMTRATNGWGAFFQGIEHGGFVGAHHIGSSAYGSQIQGGWCLRTRQTRLIGWSFSGGLAYNFEAYDPVDEVPLIAVGSHLNGLVRLGVSLANDSPISLDVGILHTSNGALKRPNQGINTPQAKLVFRLMETPNRRVLMDGADAGTWRHAVGFGIGGRDHEAYGGTLLGVHELLAQSTRVWSPKFGLTGQASVVHHMALGADASGEPSDTVGTNVLDRLQPSLAMGWSWLFGRARLDMLYGGVLANRTPGFPSNRLAKAQLFMSMRERIDWFVELRFTDWRADYLSTGVVVRWGQNEKDCITCPKWDQ